MLILPLHRKPTRESFPVVTVLLVLANVLVFFALQSGDARQELRAAERYVDSGVLALEWRWFEDWAETVARPEVDPESIDRVAPPVGQDDRADLLRLMAIERHPSFHEAVREGWFAPLDSPAYARWASARDRLEADRELSFTRRHMLGYDEPRPTALLAHMFMHGSVAHLLGNMLFLVVLGLLLEPALGAGRYLPAYLLGGLGAAGVSLGIHWGEVGGMVGASGAIACLMGLMAVVYGTRRIRFFYWFFVYFDYVRAPALVLLPLWLGWEVLAFFIDEGSNVAYDAHIGGIVAGALLGLLLVKTGQVRSAWLDSVEADDRAGELLHSDRRAVQSAQSALDALDAASAKKRLRPLLGRHGRDPDLLRLYLAACQLGADDPELHGAAARIFRLSGETEAERQLIEETLQRYLDATSDRPRLQVAQAVDLARRLIAWRRLAPARRLVDLLARARRPVPGLADLAAELVRLMDSEGLPDAETARYRRLSAA
ncbi:MAG: rhomboid family intramembrane serine protease [Gammaproteobacteria bacterium]|jgi:membrane associated rhomboid family serine protease|nr:rhomboid family intramembrane serine protease [Gammaproteobacteria bacterium]NBD95418.1 rhomboid family intramembrane serine protease [Gammaproteobacteria bacterium]